MFSGYTEQLASQRHTELAARYSKLRPASRPRRGTLRRNTGWAIVAVGLRIAESGNRRPSVATVSHVR